MTKVAPEAMCATEPPPFVSYVLIPDAARHPSMVPLAKVSVPAATPKAPPGFAAAVLALVLVTLRTVAPSMVNEPPFTVMRAEVRVVPEALPPSRTHAPNVKFPDVVKEPAAENVVTCAPPSAFRSVSSLPPASMACATVLLAVISMVLPDAAAATA